MQQIHMKQNIILINNYEKVSSRHFDKDPEASIEYSSNMQDVYKNIEICSPKKLEDEALKVFDDTIPGTIKNKKQNSIVTELYT